MKALFKAMAAGLTVVFVAGACAQNVGDINRVQPNFVKKSDFEGEWYIRQTVADVGPMAAFAFVGMQLEMEKIRWEITESHLVAYRSHERYPGLNPLADQDGKRIGHTPYADGTDDGHYSDFYKDAPVAAYRIISHFDIQRQYNSATGEQTNVIVENASDRPWFEREYMRVDWANNQITHYTAQAGNSGVRFPNPCPSFMDLAQYVPEDVGGDWAFRMEDADGNPVIVDPTRVRPDERSDVNYIDFTARLFVQPPMVAFSQGPNQPPICVASCYLLAGTNDCTAQEVKVRTSVLRVPQERTFHPRLFDDHDMMKFGFFRTERKLYDRRTGERDPNFLRYANIHNIWENAYDAQGNVLPYEQRTPKAVVYALSPNYPAELLPEAEQMARNWSRALARAVAGAQGRDLEDVEAQFPTDRNGQYVNEGLFRLNYNEDGSARIGDLRHNFIYWVDQPQLRAPLGYGPSSADPETGEIISGQAFVYGASIDRYAHGAMEVVQALMGEYDIDEISRGEDVRQFMESRMPDRVDPRAFFHHPHHDEWDLDHLHIDELRLENDPAVAARLEAIRQIGLDDQLFEGLESRMQRLKGTGFEAMMVNDEIRASLPSPDLARGPLSLEVVAAARPFTTGLHSEVNNDRMRRDWASRNNIWLAEFSDPSVMGLAMYIKERMEVDGWSHDDAYQYLRAASYYSVMDHEIGHTMGLRHNFQGTFDSINYFDDYWDMRRENLHANPTTIQHFNEMSALTQDQIEGRMREYQYSSIMDYSPRFYSSATKGLGRYDEAAVMFAYGEAVEVFETAGNQFRNRYFRRYSDGSPLFEDRLSPLYEHILDVTHYTRIPFMMGDGDLNTGLQRMRERRVIPYSVVQEMRDPSHPQHANRWVEVPYMFCTDHQVGIQASCHRHIEGADMLEQTRFLIDSWDSYFWFSHFRRDRWGWQASSALNRSLNGYFAYFPNFYQHWLWGVHFAGTVDESTQQIYMQMAAVEGVNKLSSVLTTPTYGNYWYDEDSDAYLWETTYNPGSTTPRTAMYLDRGVARRPSSRWDVNTGLHYHYYQQEAGHFWDYLAALFALSEGSATVVGVETQSDFQSYWIPYYLIWSEQLDRLYTSKFAYMRPPVHEDLTEETLERIRGFAPRLIDGELVHRPLVDFFGIQQDEDPYPDATVVVPYYTSSQQFYSIIYGMLGFVNTLDLDFAEQNRVVRLGGGETLEAAPGFEVVRFENPLNGVVYGALHRIGSQPNGAVRMLQTANEMKERYEAEEVAEWRLSQVADWIEVQRGLANMFGRVF